MAALADEFYSSSLDRQQRRKQNGGSDEDDTGRDSEPENGTIRNNRRKHNAMDLDIQY